MEVIAEGSEVLLYFSKKYKYLVKVTKQKFSTHRGVVDLSQLIGKPFGSTLETDIGEKFVAAKPTFMDYLERFRKVTQVIYPKDAAAIVLFGCIGPGSRVVEAGLGSGALCAVLAYYVRPTGKVYSYEIRREFIEVAVKNLSRVNLLDYVVIKEKDITTGIDEENVDAVVLDMATPWLVVPHAYRALRNGGYFICFSPTINQVEKVVKALKEHNFIDITTFELLLRTYKVEEGSTRPETWMVAHTGYLTVARKP